MKAAGFRNGAVLAALVVLTSWASFTREGKAAVRKREEILRRRPVVAEIQEFAGEVHLKTSRSVNWSRVGGKVKVSPGDLIFVGRGGNAKLFYTKEKSSIALSEESIFEVEASLPASTKHKRVFGNARHRGGPQPRKPDGDGTFSRLMLNPTKGEPRAEPESESSGALSVDRKVRAVGYGNLKHLEVKVVARAFPARLTLIVEELSPAPLLFGYLWRQDAASEPVWNATSAGLDFDVAIPGEGTYVFQAVSEDDTLLTMPVKIEAVSLANLPKVKLLPEDLSGGQGILLR